MEVADLVGADIEREHPPDLSSRVALLVAAGLTPAWGQVAEEPPHAHAPHPEEDASLSLYGEASLRMHQQEYAQALQLFEQGVELARTCHEQLEAAEQRVASLVRGPEGIEERPLDR